MPRARARGRRGPAPSPTTCRGRAHARRRGCSFDTFLAKYGLDDPALHELARIVRGADTERLDLTPQSPGLLAISLGLRSSFEDDHEVLRHGFVLYDALHRWCRDLKGETHGWPPKMTAAA